MSLKNIMPLLRRILSGAIGEEVNKVVHETKSVEFQEDRRKLIAGIRAIDPSKIVGFTGTFVVQVSEDEVDARTFVLGSPTLCNLLIQSQRLDLLQMMQDRNVGEAPCDCIGCQMEREGSDGLPSELMEALRASGIDVKVIKL